MIGVQFYWYGTVHTYRTVLCSVVQLFNRICTRKHPEYKPLLTFLSGMHHMCTHSHSKLSQVWYVHAQSASSGNKVAANSHTRSIISTFVTCEANGSVFLLFGDAAAEGQSFSEVAERLLMVLFLCLEHSGALYPVKEENTKGTGHDWSFRVPWWPSMSHSKSVRTLTRLWPADSPSEDKK